MTTYKTSELEGYVLDAAVAHAEGLKFGINPRGGKLSPICIWERPEPPGVMHFMPWVETYYAPSTDWSQGGPIIEREQISIEFGRNQEAFPGWSAISGPVGYEQDPDAFGTTPLIAAMRAYVATKLGETVDLPGKPQGEQT